MNREQAVLASILPGQSPFPGGDLVVTTHSRQSYPPHS